MRQGDLSRSHCAGTTEKILSVYELSRKVAGSAKTYCMKTTLWVVKVDGEQIVSQGESSAYNGDEEIDHSTTRKETTN